MKILKTKDYARFNFIKGNREPNRAHINALKNAILGNDLSEYFPIIVNNKNEVVDGQHRLIALMEMELPLYYLNSCDLGLPEIQSLNSNTSKWNLEDYLKSFIARGFKDYITFAEFRKRWRFSIGDTLSIFCGGGRRVEYIAFRAGEFKIKNLNKSVRTAKMIYEFEPFYKNFKRRSFVMALCIIFEHPEYSHKRMLQKVTYQSQRMMDCISSDDYLRMLEKVYNFKTKDKIRFL